MPILKEGVRHLKLLLGKYQGDLELSLEHVTQVSRAVEKHGGIPPICGDSRLCSTGARLLSNLSWRLLASDAINSGIQSTLHFPFELSVVWTLPNLLSLFRIGIIPVLVYLLTFNDRVSAVLAALLFLIASITDYFDGYLARRN